jgi:predicted transcriptional regulator
MSETAPTSQLDFIERTVDVVAAYVSNNSLPSAELPALIASIHEALNAISFIDGKSYKTLKRHLTKHGLDPQSYRERYGLPADYPTTSANYSAQRSALAKSLGLGQPGRSQSAANDAEPADEAASTPAPSRRKTAAATTKSRASRKVEAA